MTPKELFEHDLRQYERKGLRTYGVCMADYLLSLGYKLKGKDNVDIVYKDGEVELTPDKIRSKIAEIINFRTFNRALESVP